MKKLIYLLLCSFILAGCGSNELESFANEFNEAVENEDVDKLNPDDFGELEELEEIEELDIAEDDFKWRDLYESDRYTISADYEDGKKLSGFSISIDSSEPYEEQEGKGYRASVSIANALGLSSKDFANNFKSALTEDIHSYTEDNYEIRFVNIGWDSSIDTSISIGFEKSQ